MDEYRFGLQSMRSWCDQTFESEEVKCLFGAFALFMAHAPDDAGGAELAWLFGTVLQDAGNNLVKGGMHHVSLALADHLRSLGGEIRTSAGVEKILVGSGRATGVRLESGEELPIGRLVASGVDPGQLALTLLGEGVVGPEIAGKMERYEWGDAAFVIYVALDGPVEYKAGPEAGAACHVHLTPPSLASVARASVECRGGELPATPLVVAWNDSVIDASRAPEDKHLKKFVVLGVPYEIKGDATGHVRERDWDEAKEGYADYLIDRMTADYIPGLKERLLKREAHSPLDLERKLSSAVHGTICHGAMLPYQSASISGRRSPPGQPGCSISHHEAAETFRDPRRALRRAQGRCEGRPGWDLLPHLDADLRFDHLLPPEHRDHGPRARRRGTGLQLRPLRQPYRPGLRGGARVAGDLRVRSWGQGFRLRLGDGCYPRRARGCGADRRGHGPSRRPTLRIDGDPARPGLRRERRRDPLRRRV